MVKIIIVTILTSFIWLNLGLCAEDEFAVAEKLFDQKKFQEAIPNYQKALTKYDKNSNLTAYIQNQIAESYFRSGKWTESEKEFAKIEEKYPISPFCDDAGFKRARCKYEQKKYEEAAKQFESYAEKYKAGKNVSMAYAYAAFCYQQSKHQIKALKCYNEFKKRNKDKVVKLDKKLIERINKIEEKNAKN